MLFNLIWEENKQNREICLTSAQYQTVWMKIVKMKKSRLKHRKNNNLPQHLKNLALNGKLLKIPTSTRMKEKWVSTQLVFMRKVVMKGRQILPVKVFSFKYHVSNNLKKSVMVKQVIMAMLNSTSWPKWNRASKTRVMTWVNLDCTRIFYKENIMIHQTTQSQY